MENTKNKMTEAVIDEAIVSAIEAAVENALTKAVGAAVDTAIEKMIAKVEEMRAVQAQTAISLTLNGAVSGESGNDTPDKRVDFSKLSYSELCEFLERHPSAML
jgi:dynactin complex subunit